MKTPPLTTVRRARGPLYLFLSLGFIFSFIQSAHSGSATWNLAPATGDWNTAANWTPATVPNSPNDTATFASSSVTAVLLSGVTPLNGITFNSGASAFTITTPSGTSLYPSGTGVINNSGITQNFVIDVGATGGHGTLTFSNSASAGTMTSYTNKGATFSGPSGTTMFIDHASAGGATFTNETSSLPGVAGGLVFFYGGSTAGNATFVNEEGIIGGGGTIYFQDSSSAGEGEFTNHPFSSTNLYAHATAASGTFTIDGANHVLGAGGQVTFSDNSTAASATLITNGATAEAVGGEVGFSGSARAGRATFITNGGTTVSGAAGGQVSFQESATADAAYFVNNGAGAVGAMGGSTSIYGPASAGEGKFVANGGDENNLDGGAIYFYSGATAANGTLIANPGSNGGSGGKIIFGTNPDGGTAKVKLFGSGALDVSEFNSAGVTIGSLEGNGLVFLGSYNLSVGTNNRSTTFAGRIQDGGMFAGSGGSLSKVGSGTLILRRANTYTGGTIITDGTLLIGAKTGSSTGTGTVLVAAGTLGGMGNISGAVTVGTGSGPGAFLTPKTAHDKPALLIIQNSLTFQSDSTYAYELQTSNSLADQVTANGVTINSGAQVSFTDLDTGTLAQGTVFTAINNTAATPIAGTFANLADGSTFTVGANTFKASYTGGTGNDLTLTVVP